MNSAHDKVETVLKGSLDSKPSPSMKIQIMGIVNKILKKKIVKVMESNPGYLFKSFLL